jgi:chemotaxis signal transduction protein
LSDAVATWIEVAIAELRYAFSASAVLRVARPGPLEPLAAAPPFVAGTTSVDGNRTVVVDLRLRLGLSRTALSESTRVVFLDTESPCGVLVDSAPGVLHAPLSSLHDVPRRPFASACLRGVLVIGDDARVLVLDPTLVAFTGGTPCLE